MISHQNVIANTMQYCIFEDVGRKKYGIDTQVELGLLPFSHIYGLVVVAHSATWRGDEVIVLPKFELTDFLRAIERFKINHIPLVRLSLPRPRLTVAKQRRFPPLSSACSAAKTSSRSTTSAASGCFSLEQHRSGKRQPRSFSRSTPHGTLVRVMVSVDPYQLYHGGGC